MRTTWFLVTATLLLAACTGGTLTRDEDGGAQRASDGGVDAADFCVELSAIVCASNERCCGGVVAGEGDDEVDGGVVEEASCEAQQLEACRASVDALLEDPRTAYAPERGQAYLDALRADAEGCFAEPPRLADLLEVFQGTGAEGADCTPASVADDAALRVSQLSCADGLTCHLYRRSDGSPIGVCEPREDDACSHRFDCAAGQWCNLPDAWEPGRWGNCQPLKTNGWGCTSDLECASQYCDTTRTCADPLEQRYCAAVSYEGAVLTDRPLGYWRLGDAGAETAADRGERGLDGAYRGGPSGAEGAGVLADDGALALDGVDDAMVVAGVDARRSGDAISMECWFRRDAASTTGPLLEFNDEAEGLGARLWNHHSADRVHANFLDEAGEGHAITSAEGVIAADTWYHVVATYDGSVGRLYVNGERVGEDVMGAFRPRVSGDLYVGLREEDERHMIGAIDEVAVYDRALTQSQIRRHLSLGAEGPAPQDFVLFRWLR